jgi:hypothetical protein
MVRAAVERRLLRSGRRFDPGPSVGGVRLAKVGTGVVAWACGADGDERYGGD